MKFRFVEWVRRRLTRAQVYKLIDEERQYQIELPKERTTNAEHEVGTYIAMIQHYLNEANHGYTKVGSDFYGLCGIRKIAALAVRCMEENGAPSRADEQKVLAGQ